MASIIRTITIFVVLSNAAAGFLIAAGAPQVYGIEPEPGVDQEVERANESASSIEDNLGIVESLVGLTITVVNTITDIFSALFAAPTLLLNLGVPRFIVTFVFAPLYIAAGIDVLGIIKGMNIR